MKIRASGQQKSGIDKIGSRVSRQETKAGKSKTTKQKFDWSQLPDVLALLKPRRGIIALGFVLMVVNRLCGMVLPASTKYLLDDVMLKKQTHLLYPIVAAVLAATIVQGLTSFSLTQLLSKASWRMISEMREKVQAHIGRLQIAYYDANKTGVLISRIMSDVEGVRNLVGTGLIEFAGGIMTALFALVYLLHTSVLMTGVAAGVLLVFGVALNQAFKTIRPIFRERPKINAEVTGRLTESMGGVRVVKGYHAEDREEKVFAAGAQRLLENVLKTLTAPMIMSLAARQILAGTMTPGTFFSFTFFLGLLIAPVFQIVGIGPQITEALAGLERTREVLNEKMEQEDPRRTQSLGRSRGEVQFDNVNFAYDTGKMVLHDVSFDSQPGTVTALVGPSGAGKSTVIGLIAAFYVPASGRVLVDGIDLSQVKLDTYRTQLGVVLQETFLFDGSIRQNVAFSRPEATEAEIMDACRIARVDEFAEHFEKGYDTIVGERGVKLSGGQRQRVSIARAILADPRILILDEATSSLDSESESFIQEGLRYLMRGRTTFVIAHRLSTVRRADQILVVEAGRVIERGDHKSLYDLGGRYYELYTKQYGLESNLFLAPGEGTGNQPDGADPNGANGSNANATDAAALPEAIRIIRSGGS